MDNTLRSLRFSKLYNPYEIFFHNDFMDVLTGEEPINTPFINIMDENKNYRIEMAAPGLKREDFKITVEGNVMTISCKNDNVFNEVNIIKIYTRKEYSYSGFSRSLTIPDDADADSVNAKYKDGIVSITINRK